MNTVNEILKQVNDYSLAQSGGVSRLGSVLNLGNPVSMADCVSTQIQSCKNIQINVRDANTIAGAVVGAAIGLAADSYYSQDKSHNITSPIIGAIAGGILMRFFTGF